MNWSALKAGECMSAASAKETRRCCWSPASAATAERAPFVRLADRYALVFVPVTVVVASNPVGVTARRLLAADVRRERDWHELCAAHACPVPPVLGVAGTDDPEGDGPAAIVLDPGPRQSLLERLGEHPIAIPDLLRAMAGLHARVHGVPVAGAPRSPDRDGAPGPLAALDRALGASAGLADRFSAERAWLGAHVPEPGAPVVCHGDLQPASVRLDGGDPASAQVVNWSRARVADAEYDLALTLLVFWSVPYLAEGMGQRKLLKTVRDMLTAGYRTAYETARGVAPDEGRLGEPLRQREIEENLWRAIRYGLEGTQFDFAAREVISTRPLARFFTGWFAPRWPRCIL